LKEHPILYRNTGVTLIELCVTLAIIGTITLAAIASYTHVIANQRRIEAQQLLLDTAQNLESFHSSRGTYLGAPITNENTNRFYELSIHDATSTSFVLVASPKEATSGDGIIVLWSSNIRGWDKDNSERGVAASYNNITETELSW